MRPVYLLFVAAFCCLFSCEKLTETPADDQTLDGPLEGLEPEQLLLHIKGDEAFNDQVFTEHTGLGGIFVAASCGSCHAADGKGHPLTTLTRFGRTTVNGYDPMLEFGGPQLQNRSAPGYVPEAIPAEATGIARFTPPAVAGLGFLELVSDADLLALADPDDTDQDGISGRAHYVNPPDYFSPKPYQAEVNGQFIGRFGKKAGALDLLHQTVNAYNEDMGITTDFRMRDQYNYLYGDHAVDGVADPEAPEATVRQVVFYLQTLKAPVQRNPDSPENQRGSLVFQETGCASCHTPTLKTASSPIHALSEKTFHPYTDLLLHDMGPGLDDGYTEGSAGTGEWRTPALWGLGLSHVSQGGKFYLMHDGRAESIEEAILLHGGEAEQSRQQFTQLSEQEREDLLNFLHSL